MLPNAHGLNYASYGGKKKARTPNAIAGTTGHNIIGDYSKDATVAKLTGEGNDGLA